MSIEQEAISTYQNNLNFLHNNHIEVYKKIDTLSQAIELGAIKENYLLEYKDDKYFDILNLKDDTYLYNSDSNRYTKKTVDSMKFDEYSNTFHTLFKNPKALGKPYDYLEGIFEYINKNKKDDKKFHIIPKCFFLGTLLGMHIPKILEKLSVKRCFIYEPNLEVFRLSLFTTKYYEISEHTDLSFSILEDNISFKKSFTTFLSSNFNLNYAIKFNCLDIYNEQLKDITAMISAGQAYRMNFLRRLNIYKLSLQKVVDNNNLLNINKKIETLNDKKIIVVGSGPSLDKNIDWFCQHKDSFIIVSVGASLPTLLKYNITPDIVVEVHPELDILDTYKDIDKNDLKDIIFLGASQIPKELVEQFDINNSFIFLTNMIIKEYLGVKTGTSVGNVAIYLSLMLNPEELYLLGIDFALSSEGSTHADSHAHTKTIDDTTQMDIKQKNYIHEGNLFAVKGNLKESVLTNSLFYKFLEGANNELSLHKDNKIYNLSDGAYIENTTPLKADDVEISSIYDKVNFKQEFKNELENISEHGFNTKDLESINNMIKLLNDYTTTEYNDKDIRKYFNDILINENLDGAYKELILNFVQMIFHYVDGFLNDESFNFKQRTKHIKNMDKLLHKHFIKLTIDYKKILEDKIK